MDECRPLDGGGCSFPDDTLAAATFARGKSSPTPCEGEGNRGDGSAAGGGVDAAASAPKRGGGGANELWHHHAGFWRCLGRAVQVDPMKSTLKASGTKRLTLKSDDPLSNVAFRFQLRRYTLKISMEQNHRMMSKKIDAEGLLCLVGLCLSN